MRKSERKNLGEKAFLLAISYVGAKSNERKRCSAGSHKNSLTFTPPDNVVLYKPPDRARVFSPYWTKVQYTGCRVLDKGTLF